MERGVSERVSFLPRANKALSLEKLTNRARRRPVFRGIPLHQQVVDHLRSIVRVLSPERDNGLSYLGADPMRVSETGSRSVLEPDDSFFPKSLKQLVASLLADTKSIADAGDRLIAIQAGLDKCKSLRHE